MQEKSNSLNVVNFLKTEGVILDVRSPAEYDRGHIPTAHSFPLFDNDERAQVGICYKQKGRFEAIELGLGMVGPKLARFVATAKRLSPDWVVKVHCWRGGMRSGSMAWLLKTAGLRVYVLAGGYKAFRQWVCRQFAQPQKMILLGGMTGSSKTDILQALQRLGEQIIDLEHFANHRGSSFGALGLPPQPTSEQYSNNIALQWCELDRDKPVWIEAEGSSVGTCSVPQEIFKQMQQALLTIKVVRSLQERIKYLVQVYGDASIEDLVICTQRISKRLGGQNTTKIVELLRSGDLESATELLLKYYDKTYKYVLKNRAGKVFEVEVIGQSADEAAKTILKNQQEIYSNSLSMNF